MNVEARERGAAAFELEGGGVTAGLPLRAYHVGEILRVCDIGHVSPVVICFLSSLARLGGEGKIAFPGRSAARSSCEAVRCRAGAPVALLYRGPGSAKQREERCIAPGTRKLPPCRPV